jgi:hypothetical protein
MRNDGMNNQFRERCHGFHFNRTRNANRSESTVGRSVCDLHLSRARKAKSRVYPRSLDRGQAARFSKGDGIAASPVGLLGVPTFLFPPVTKSVILCFFRRPEDVKAVASEAGVIAVTVHAIVDFDENKCGEKETVSGSGCLAQMARRVTVTYAIAELIEKLARIVSGRNLGRKSTKQRGIAGKK